MFLNSQFFKNSESAHYVTNNWTLACSIRTGLNKRPRPGSKVTLLSNELSPEEQDERIIACNEKNILLLGYDQKLEKKPGEIIIGVSIKPSSKLTSHLKIVGEEAYFPNKNINYCDIKDAYPSALTDPVKLKKIKESILGDLIIPPGLAAKLERVLTSKQENIKSSQNIMFFGNRAKDTQERENVENNLPNGPEL